jgi:hypothetical protein
MIAYMLTQYKLFWNEILEYFFLLPSQANNNIFARLTTWNTGHVLLYSIQDSGEESIAYCDAREDRCTIGASDFRRT